MQKRLKEWINPFLEDEALTDGLTDAQAKLLLDWAQGQVSNLAAQARPLAAEDAERFIQPRLKRLRARLRQVAQASAQADDPVASLKTLLPRAAFHFSKASKPAREARPAGRSRSKASRG